MIASGWRMSVLLEVAEREVIVPLVFVITRDSEVGAANCDVILLLGLSWMY
jgi:hypothetical protein